MSSQTQDHSLEQRAQRLDESLQYLQLVTRTFVSLSQNDRRALSDTLISLLMTHLEVERGATLLLDPGTGAYRVAASQGVDGPAVLETLEAQALWRRVADEGVPLLLDAADVSRSWSTAPAAFRGGIAVAPVSIQDHPVGTLVLAEKVSGASFNEENRAFLGAAAGLAAMAFANADAFQAQRRLLDDVERKAEEAQRESREKAAALAQLDEKLEIIERQRFAIQELSTPILQIWDNVLALPVIGVVDSRRSLDIMERLLSEVSSRQARFVILDITGVDVVDTKTADHFIKVIRAAELIGTRCIVTGIRPAVAQTLVDIGVDLSSIVTLRNLQEGLMECIRRMDEQGDATRRVTAGRAR